MAAPSVTNTFVANTTASASEVNANFSDIIDGLSSGSTWDVVVSTLNSGNITGSGTISATGLITASSGVNMGDTTLSNYEEDSFTPTWTASTNLDAVTGATLYWTRIGNTVFVKGKVSLDPTASGRASAYFDNTDLPYTVDTNAYLTGVGYRIGSPIEKAQIYYFSSRVYIGAYDNTSTTNLSWAFSFEYKTTDA